MAQLFKPLTLASPLSLPALKYTLSHTPQSNFSVLGPYCDWVTPTLLVLTYPSPSLILPTMSCALVLCKPTTSGSSPTNSCIHHLHHQPPQKPLPLNFQALLDIRFKFHSILPTSAKKKSNEPTRPTLFTTSFVIPVTESSSPPSIKGSYLITPTSPVPM